MHLLFVSLYSLLTNSIIIKLNQCLLKTNNNIHIHKIIKKLCRSNAVSRKLKELYWNSNRTLSSRSLEITQVFRAHQIGRNLEWHSEGTIKPHIYTQDTPNANLFALVAYLFSSNIIFLVSTSYTLFPVIPKCILRILEGPPSLATSWKWHNFQSQFLKGNHSTLSISSLGLLQ